MTEEIIYPVEGASAPMNPIIETPVVEKEVHHHHHHYRRSNASNMGSKAGIAALSALTGGVLTWAAMAHGGLGTTQQTLTPAEPAVPVPGLTDGSFTGAGQAVTGGDVIVTITVANGRITHVDAHYPDDWSGNAAAIPVLIDEAVAAQHASITNVTGSTVTSEAFKGSLQDAINQASGHGGGVVAVPLPAPVEPAPTPAETHPAVVAGDLHDGVFFGEGFSSGPGGNTYVTMTVHEGKIVGISATYPIGNEESAGISAGAIPTLVTEAKEAQSADIEIVTGATHTSDAFKQSLQDAINQSHAGTSMAAPLGTVNDGTFVGNPASTGRAGDAVVTITVAGGHITDITADMPDHSWGDTSNEAIIPVLVEEAKETQSAHLNFVTGATGSSTAFMTSLQSAINQARG